MRNELLKMKPADFIDHFNIVLLRLFDCFQVFVQFVAAFRCLFRDSVSVVLEAFSILREIYLKVNRIKSMRANFNFNRINFNRTDFKRINFNRINVW